MLWSGFSNASFDLYWCENRGRAADLRRHVSVKHTLLVLPLLDLSLDSC